jgi:hypothetical protein
MYEAKKRKRQHNDKRHHRQHHHHHEAGTSSSRRPEEDSALSIQAHEADIRRGAQAHELAESLEVVEYIKTSPHEPLQVKPRVGRALIRWDGGSGPVFTHSLDEEEETISLGTTSVTKDKQITHDESAVWVDR